MNGIEGLKARVRRSALYPLIRSARARAEKAALEALVKRLASGGRVEVNSWVTEQLRELKGARRPLPAELGQANVIGVGALGWERHGLWPSLERACGAYSTFTDDLGEGVPFHCGSRAEQDARGKRLLHFVDAWEKRNGPVHLIYIYADPSNLGKGLLSELSRRGIWTVLMGLDDRHTFVSRPRGDLAVGVEEVAPLVDLYWTSWQGAVALHQKIGSRAWLGGAAADPHFFRPVTVPRDIDVLFVGQSYGVRGELVAYLRKMGLEVTARGYGWDGGFLEFDETVRLLSRARIVLGISNVGLMGDVSILKGRDFEAPMCGACYVTQYSEEITRYFDLGRDIVCYGSFLEAAEIIHSLLRDPARCEQLRSNALRRSLERNTWERRLQEMYGVLNGASGH